MAIPTAAATTAGTNNALSMMVGPAVAGVLGYNTFQNPGDAANQYLSQIAETITPYYNPYIKTGKASLPATFAQYMKLLRDPGGMLNQMGSQFQASPGYSYQVQQATNAANQAASAGGMLGSPQEQQELSQNIMGMANQDYYNFLDRTLKLYGQGLSGMGNFNQMGLQAATSLAGQLSRALEAQARAAYGAANAENQSSGGLIGSVTSIL